MYAVVRTGGKQYRVGAGDILEVEKLDGDVGDELTINDVLLVSNGERVVIGQPLVENASVSAVITGQYRGPKVLSFRYRPKKRIRVRRGHRQYITRLEIKSVGLGGETFSDAMELGPTPTVVAKPKKRANSGVAAAAAASVVETAEETVVETVDAVEASADDAVEAVTEAASDAVEEVADAAESVSDSVAETAEEAADAASDVADSVEDAVDTASDAVDATKDSE